MKDVRNFNVPKKKKNPRRQIRRKGFASKLLVPGKEEGSDEVPAFALGTDQGVPPAPPSGFRGVS